MKKNLIISSFIFCTISLFSCGYECDCDITITPDNGDSIIKKEKSVSSSIRNCQNAAEEVLAEEELNYYGPPAYCEVRCD